MEHASPTPKRRLSLVEAYERFQFARQRSAERVTALHERLSEDEDVIRVLFFLYLDLGSQAVHERTEPSSVYHAREQGWITGDRRLALTAEGLGALWDWKEALRPHLRDERFAQLWRDVISW
ncbi:hypothetical protein LX86_006943 [Lentzea aerocolonigenes]|nr:hypothetical protein [Lentzea aerocolonigenes]